MTQRRLDFRSFDEVLAEVEQLHRAGYEKGGRWDLGQTCTHLAYFLECGLDGADFKVPWLLRTLFGRYFFRKILRERRMKVGVPTPKQGNPPATIDQEAAIARLRKIIERTVAHQGDFLPSPFFGPATPEEWRNLMLIHCGHHLGFLHPKS